MKGRISCYVDIDGEVQQEVIGEFKILKYDLSSFSTDGNWVSCAVTYCWRSLEIGSDRQVNHNRHSMYSFPNNVSFYMSTIGRSILVESIEMGVAKKKVKIYQRGDGIIIMGGGERMQYVRKKRYESVAYKCCCTVSSSRGTLSLGALD